MERMDGSVARAEEIVRGVLAASPQGVPAIVLVDRLVEWGFAGSEAVAILHELREARRLEVDRGRYRARR